jgi:hypothetical protein
VTRARKTPKVPPGTWTAEDVRAFNAMSAKPTEPNWRAILAAVVRADDAWEDRADVSSRVKLGEAIEAARVALKVFQGKARR